jgi:hypothetical protein
MDLIIIGHQYLYCLIEWWQQYHEHCSCCFATKCVAYVTTENRASLDVCGNKRSAHSLLVVSSHRLLSRRIKGQTHASATRKTFLLAMLGKPRLSSKLTLLTLLQIDPASTPLRRNHGSGYG